MADEQQHNYTIRIDTTVRYAVWPGEAATCIKIDPCGFSVEQWLLVDRDGRRHDLRRYRLGMRLWEPRQSTGGAMGEAGRDAMCEKTLLAADDVAMTLEWLWARREILEPMSGFDASRVGQALQMYRDLRSSYRARWGPR